MAAYGVGIFGFREGVLFLWKVRRTCADGIDHEKRTSCEKRPFHPGSSSPLSLPPSGPWFWVSELAFLPWAEKSPMHKCKPCYFILNLNYILVSIDKSLRYSLIRYNRDYSSICKNKISLGSEDCQLNLFPKKILLFDDYKSLIKPLKKWRKIKKKKHELIQHDSPMFYSLRPFVWMLIMFIL